MTIAKWFVAAILAVGVAQGAPALTQVQDMLYKADGTPFTGTAVVSWGSFTAADGSVVPQNSIALPIKAGALFVRLAPTTNASTAARYTVRFTADGRTQFTEKWAVPPSVAPLRLWQVRVSEESAAPVAAESLLIGDVDGLLAALEARPAKGVTFEPGRSAVIDSQGEIGAAVGAPGDCVRVDGTAGSCGGVMPVWVDLETPAGVVNGVNTVFVLSEAPSPAGSLHLYRNGVLQRVGVDYSLNGSTVTFNAVATPQVGDWVVGSWRR